MLTTTSRWVSAFAWKTDASGDRKRGIGPGKRRAAGAPFLFAQSTSSLLAVIIAIPDDYHGVVPKLDCMTLLAEHDVRVLRDVAPSRELIAALPRLKLLSQTGRSTHHIDLTACRERGIAIASGTHASPYTVAEHTWALILAAARRIPEETALMKRGEWRSEFSLGLRG